MLETADDRSGIYPLFPADIASLRLSWRSRTGVDTLRETLQTFPNRSVWMPDTLEYAVVAPWRNRRSVPGVIELAAQSHPDELLDAVIERCIAAGDTALVILENDEVRPPSFYSRHGMAVLETVITYEMRLANLRDRPVDTLAYHSVHVADAAMVDALVELDNRSFPWIWWNCREEFQTYGSAPGVDLIAVTEDESLIGYIGMTTYPGWGHLDRIAVDPNLQGQGYGRRFLDWILWAFGQRGVRTVALSTQKDNESSRRLYESVGFGRSPVNDYRVYGRYFQDFPTASARRSTSNS